VGTWSQKVWVIVGLRHPTGSGKYRIIFIMLMEVLQTCSFGFQGTM